MPNRKQRQRTAKQVDKLTAAFIRTNPSALTKFTKEVIRDRIVTELLFLAFRQLDKQGAAV